MNLASLNIDYLARERYPDSQRISTIKNKAEAQILSVLPNEISNETYSVVVNDKCVWVDETGYWLDNCAKKLGKQVAHEQYFDAQKITNGLTERKVMGKQYSGAGNIYPYTAFIHKTTQGCLTYDKDGLSVIACNPDNNHQKWEISPDKNMCLMD